MQQMKLVLQLVMHFGCGSDSMKMQVKDDVYASLTKNDCYGVKSSLFLK